MIGLLIAASVALIVLGGYLAAIDAALAVRTRGELFDLATTTPRRASSFTAVANDLAAHVNVVNFVRVAAETLAAVMVTLLFTLLFEQWWQVLLASTLLMACVSFVLVGVSPRSIGAARADGLLRFSIRFVRLLRFSLGFIANALVWVGGRVMPGSGRKMVFSSEQQLLNLVDEATENDVLEEEDRTLIHSIIGFSDTLVREVMVPRTDMITVNAGTTVSEAMEAFLGTGVSRIPVTGEDVDEILGLIYLRDTAEIAFQRRDGFDSLTAAEFLKPALFVPDSKKADDLLRQMQEENTHLAIVVDEYGGIAGLITLEDLVEELVGDIFDEYDSEVSEYAELGEDRYRVSAKLSVGQLGELFGIDLSDPDVSTVGGLFVKHLGRLPEAGDRTEVSGLTLVAERIEGRRRRLITLTAEADPALREARSAFQADFRRPDTGPQQTAPRTGPQPTASRGTEEQS